MIKENQIRDNGIKLANEIRDDSLKKLCKEFDNNKKIITLDKKGKEIKSKFDFLNIIRSSSGELQGWEIHYKKI